MPINTMPDPVLVTTSQDVRALASQFSKQALLAVDTEANSLYAYHEHVCLIQFSIPRKDYIVDPLVIDDLSPLGDVFANPEIEKIFHAAEYDLIVLQRDFGYTFANLFDTMVAARILGWRAVGLSSILKSHFGINVDKKYQRADWGRRPIAPEMLKYAQLDTHYLIPLRETLKDELMAADRWELAREDFARLCQVNPASQVQKTKSCWQINGIHGLEPRQVAVLHELCRFRDRKAQALDRPLFKVIGDSALLNIAAACPRTLNELERVPGISAKQTRWLGNQILSAVQRGLNTPPPTPPRRHHYSASYLERVDRLRQWRKATGRAMGVESDVVLPKDLLYELAKKNPQSPQELAEVLHTVPWRLERYGDEIFEVLRAAD